MALLKRGGKYSVRYTVPKQYREVLGKSQVWRTTGTGCLSEAKRQAPRILSGIMDEVESDYLRLTQSSDSPKNPAYLFDSAAELLARDDLTDEEKSDIMSDLREQFLQANKKSLSQRHLTTARSATAMVLSGGREVPLTVAMKDHLEGLTGQGKNLSTVNRKEMVLQKFADWAGDPSVLDVDRELAGRWIREYLNKTDLTSKTKVWYVSALQAAWTYFLLNGKVTDNPWTQMSGLVRGSSKGVEKDQYRPWTQEEVDKLKTVPKDDPIYNVSVIRLHSGIRVEEACSLRVDDIDMKAKTMKIRAGKNQSSVRTLALHPVLVALLPGLIKKATKDGYLFDFKPAGQDGKRSQNFIKRIGRWVRKNVSKDPLLASYGLRHTYSQALRDAGVAKETIEFTTGHRDQSQLFGTYASSVATDRLREAIEKLDFGF